MPSNGTHSPIAGTAPSSAMDDAIRVENLSFRYGDALVLNDVSFAVARGSFVTLLGPSGCGKTTLLQLLGGYLKSQAGSIQLNGRDHTFSEPSARNLGMVFQSYALFPHLSAARNIAFGLEVRGVPRVQRDERVKAMLDRVGLTLAEGERFPAQLSGGQQQRVALARALAFEPQILLLDEPLANLDRHLREQLRAEIRRIHEATQVTTVMVTHDQDEALAASDFIGIMNRGKLLQFAEPQELYQRPRTPFVAHFMGIANIVPGAELGFAVGSQVLIRPENVLRNGPIAGIVETITFQGPDVLAQVRCERFSIQMRDRADASLRIGDEIVLQLPREKCWLIPDGDE